MFFLLRHIIIVTTEFDGYQIRSFMYHFLYFPRYIRYQWLVYWFSEPCFSFIMISVEDVFFRRHLSIGIIGKNHRYFWKLMDWFNRRRVVFYSRIGAFIWRVTIRYIVMDIIFQIIKKITFYCFNGVFKKDLTDPEKVNPDVFVTNSDSMNSNNIIFEYRNSAWFLHESFIEE